MEVDKPHIAIIPSPGMGHLIPLLHFSKLLVTHFPFSVSLLIPSSARPAPAQIALLTSLPRSISHTFLPPVDPARLPGGVSHGVTITTIHIHSVPAVRAELGSLARRARVVALVTDLFGVEFFHVAREMEIPPYMYYTTTAMCLLFELNLPKLDKSVACEYREMHEPLEMLGCVPLHGKDFDQTAQDRTSVSYKVALDHNAKYRLADGIFINTFLDLEPGAVQALHEDPNLPPVWPIGPVIRSGSGSDESGSDCLTWLDHQPCRSVLFVSFGSGGTLSTNQLNELAIGLEKSGVRFLWVVRTPNDHSPDGSFFSAHEMSQGDPVRVLPPGFVNRVKDRGFLVPSWAPQVEVLAHGSTGGFLTHCGWNSVLESIVHGVPLIAWPLYAEQRMNAVMLNQGLNVALRPKESENGLVEADEVAKVVRELIEGEEGKRVGERMNELSEAAKRATSENGSSTKLLSEIADKWM